MRSGPRVIGLLGGMSWESSALYYRLINEGVRDRLGGIHSARCILDSLDFAEVEALQVAGDWDSAATLLAEEAVNLQHAGAEIVVLCTNTMHKVADAIEAAVSIPVLHIADATAAAVKHTEVTRVGLLGTAFTMEQSFYRERLENSGLGVVVPSSDDRADVHRIIYEELCRGIITDSSREVYRRIISSLVAEGAQGIILGCTEIELLVSSEDSPVPVFPTTAIHADAAVEWSIGRSRR
ncbi:aspartate/glutamate racemase family protein [Rhodococcus sp. Eu-32]|uniref:aspartate/glutamate racemase family protein n=1 Tax=Rhodococcus sp. Eu-32 TaxID=1017319 RepID=UPI000DF1DD62|nr:aspartate/glutamate racemase family protein [Rhodococcus sp. Eu-32]RRQ26365.1 aspartate/glutamate racemase family protein [Rhodococcus sp. Eu-32]